MKTKLIALAIIFATGTLVSQGQRVSVRMSFPVGLHIGAPGHTPFRGAIWIGPEWQWRGGRYVAVPGYWASPRHGRAIWVPGHWKYGRRGYIWVPGRWR